MQRINNLCKKITKNDSDLLIKAWSHLFVFVLGVWVFCFTPNLKAQTTSFIYYGVEQGLSQSQVQTIVQDNDRNLWIGTLAGLTKYNGKNFTAYSKKDGLAEDWITSSYKDQLGNIWFGHWAGGVSKYNGKTKKIENLNFEEYTRFKTITSIIQDDLGRLWIATEGAGIFIHDPATNTMASISRKDGLISDNIYSLCPDNKSDIWMASDSGLIICNTKLDISVSSSFGYLDKRKGLTSNHITALSFVNNNEMWVGTADAGVMVLKIYDDFSFGSLKKMVTEKSVINTSNGLGADFIQKIYEDKNHRIWIGTIGKGVTQCIPFSSSNRKEAIERAIFNVYSTREGLNYFNVNDILQDAEGNVWIGTDLGLNQYRGERFQIYDQADSLINNLIWSVLCDHDGNIWLGTNDGLSKITFKRSPFNNKQLHSIKNYTTKEGLTSNIILSMHEDDRGNLWFGTAYGGVCKLAKGKNYFENFSKADGLAGDIIFSINSDNKGNIWFGSKDGVSKFDPRTGSFRNYSSADGLGGNNVYRIFKDSKGNLWFGALGGSLSMYDGTSFRKFGETEGMPHRFILCINEDRKGNLWFGSYGGGLYKYDGKVFQNFTMKDGMSSDSPYAIIADADDNIWIGNNRGLDKLDSKSNHFNHYGKRGGFLGVETNPNAVCMDKEGSIWFGTIMGAVKFNPHENKPNKVEPKTFITGLKVFMKDAPFPEDGRFSYDENHLTFNFVGISLTNPDKVLYQYKLEGFDKDWLPGYTSLNEAVYSNIPSGKYTFMVKACNNDGVWNSTPTRYSFFVSPPFWQTAVFYILMATFILFSIYAFDKIRTRNLKVANKKLEEKVEQRTLELAQRNAELAEKNKDITDSIKYAKRLQDAILPAYTIVRKYLPESFVLFKPKDIVSGDFYWIEGRKGDEVLVAAVDCTGHGVPGAFMSIIAHNLLNQIIEENGVMDPGTILDHLNKGVKETLKQPVEDFRVKDGMDIALCSINFNKKELQFAGSYSPLYLVRNNAITEIKGNNIAIGSYSGDESTLKFNNHKLALESGDMIYLFSDGYSDQFGGPSGKKFKSTQFKDLLLSLRDSEMSRQKIVLDHTIEEWRGILEQVDDILVIGIKVQ